MSIYTFQHIPHLQLCKVDTASYEVHQFEKNRRTYALTILKAAT